MESTRRASKRARLLEQKDILTRLPAELQLRILSYFTPRELTGTVAKVCKQWWMISKDPSLWESLVFYLSFQKNGYSKKQRQATNLILKRCSLLRRLRISMCDLSEGPFQVELLSDTLKELCIIDSTFSPKYYERFVKTCPNIEVIRLFFCDVGIHHIGILVSLKKLHTVELKDCKYVNDECLKTIARNCEQLKCLTIEGHYKDKGSISDDGICDLVQCRGTGLQKLDICHADLTDKSMITIGTTCSNLTDFQIKKLDSLTDQSLEALASLSNLKVLYLYGKGFSKNALSTFFGRSCMSKLEVLTLDTRGLYDDHLCNLARTWTNLRTLIINDSSTRLTSQGLEHVIRNCKKLQTLHLRNVPPITGQEYLNCIPEYLPHLKELELGYQDDYKAAVQLKAKMPDLQVSLGFAPLHCKSA